MGVWLVSLSIYIGSQDILCSCCTSCYLWPLSLHHPRLVRPKEGTAILHLFQMEMETGETTEDKHLGVHLPALSATYIHPSARMRYRHRCVYTHI